MTSASRSNRGVIVGRELRTEFEGAMHHVMSRGTAGARLFLDDRDREMFLRLVARVVRRYGWRCHAYCLLSTHYHLLIETPQANLARGMRDLNSTYARWFNSRQGRFGHLVAGRYHAVVIDSDRQFVATVAYIVENPVAAGLCLSIEDWTWSSGPPMLGCSDRPAFLTLDDVREHFGPLAGDRPLPKSPVGVDDGLVSWRDSLPGDLTM
jgi:putative transposase